LQLFFVFNQNTNTINFLLTFPAISGRESWLQSLDQCK
jgi:hypothetical protein